ncbi:LANO_0G00254g1_1 [Lachancea nothofagi CBS 11611]|uniref:LANO_0G00254g1_1 n=1 Tax=Lachancea nothofagi CBS 11611 TaxID=1266666 RepID=A0A1G4KE96_9SACH|nr:LANO_0G00254g1_1 [Lachancea nothofagi CBS 11611]
MLNSQLKYAGERKLINDITLLAEAISNRLVLLSSSDLYFEELGKGKRFTQSTVIYLEDWFISNSSDPYLTKAKAHLLSEKTGLTIKQVRNWVSNRRRKFKRNPIEPSLERLLE